MNKERQLDIFHQVETDTHHPANELVHEPTSFLDSCYVQWLRILVELLVVITTIRPLSTWRIVGRRIRLVGQYFIATWYDMTTDLFEIAVRGNATLAKRFIKRSLWFTILTNTLATLVCTGLLVLCDDFVSPLWWWLLIFVTLQAVQLPVHTMFLRGILTVDASGQNIGVCVRSF